MDCYEFSAELWIWRARQEDGWTFVSVPPDASEEIRAYSASRPRAGFGSVRVSVTIGGSTWQTSVFPGEDGDYALPIKKSVRRLEGIDAGDVVTVILRTIADP
jgi:hypothetical protein